MLLDGFWLLEGNKCTIGLKNVTMADPLVQATAQGLFPGYLQVEASAQLGCAAILAQPENHGKLGIFLSIDKAEFLRPAFPGEQLVMQVDSDVKGRFGIATVQVFVGSTLITNATIKFAILSQAEVSANPTP
jgi:3-hydroxyacyl-[acyl-carrier-protein] dehydratase